MMQPPASPGHDDAMMTEDAMYDGLEQTQQAQAGSQPFDVLDSHLWGFLQPCTGTLTRIDFWKANPVYEIGRNPEGNNIVLLGFKVSEYWSTCMLDHR
jgi:ser/thr/tyr protein kinase RAD53